MPSKKKTKSRAPPKGPFVCYVLRHKSTNRVYTGQTNNFTRRLKQHKGLLKGGARYTKYVKTPREWKPLFQVCGFRVLRHILQFEIAMKKRKVPRNFMNASGSGGSGKAYTRGPRGRVRQLEYILSQGKLNDEPHGNHAKSKLYVKCYITKTKYLALSQLTEDEFNALRAQQGVPFHFT